MPVLQNWEHHHYRRNRPTIGFLIDWVGTPFHVELMEGVVETTEELGFNCISLVTGRYKSQWSSEKCRNILFDFVTGYNMDGLIMTASSIGNLAGYQAMDKLVREFARFPLVTLGETYPGIPSVCTDNRTGMENLLTHLIERHAYKRFAFLGGSPENQDAVHRYSAFRNILSQHKIPLNPALVMEGYFRQEDGQRFVESVWKPHRNEIDVIVCANDTMALGVLQALKQEQVDVPGDVAVTGFDDDQFSRYAKLSTVHQSFYNQGRIAVQKIQDMLQGAETEERTLVVPRLQLRQSCGCQSLKEEDRADEPAQPLEESVVGEFRSQKEANIQDIMEAVAPLQRKSALLSDWVETLYQAFLLEIEEPGKEHLLAVWRKIIGWATEQENLVYSLRTVLRKFGGFFKRLGPWQHYFELRVLEDAGKSLDEVIQYSLTYKKILFDYQLEAIDETGERIISDLDRHKQLQVIQNDFPALGINSCFISFYENKENPQALSRLMLAYDEGTVYPIDEPGIQFPSTTLIPAGFLSDKKRYSLLVHALFQGDEQIGFMVVDTRSRAWRSYEILRHKLSMAFRASDLFREIYSYTERLEEQVRARTRELEDANRQLHQEIAERKKAEQELVKKEAYFRELALLLPTIILELDLSYRLVFINQAGLDVLGLSEQEAMQKDSLLELICDEDEEYAEEYLTKIIRLKRAAYSEFRLLNPDGHKTSLLAHASPIISNGVIKGVRISAMRIKPLLSSVVVPEDLFFEHYNFSPRVKEVLMLLLQGLKTKEIAKKLFITESTVKAHIRALYTEVGVGNRTEFFKVLEDYQIQQFGYQSYTYSLLSKLIRD